MERDAAAFHGSGCIRSMRKYNPRATGAVTPGGVDVKDSMDDIDEPLDDEDLVAEEDLDDLEPSEADLEEAAGGEPPEPPEPTDAAASTEVESIQDLLVKQEARAEEEEAEEDEETAVALTRDERLEPLDTRVIPMQATEFVCKNCFLVKHRSQLADKKRMLCRDCA